ncbi:hypothetical protein GYMLUDRAFT_247720 [Collybiopsis luxurians FD-317 M1]|uniref:Uncharacterized protein n=1 Tax=Collybiopsis luxurians FD-317 M1 TaxID=944289 RepID=A0A0D0BNU8_9AGAR|nr:hypothetical protein GYMLUDRAFT_247720 [Collybiopsis luxurians FD-317 M1]
MLVVSDVKDVFLSKHTDLLLDLPDSVIGIATGLALQAGFKLIAPIGGKIIALSSDLHSVGVGAAKNREDSKIWESDLLQAAPLPHSTRHSPSNAREQVSADMFLFSSIVAVPTMIW